MLSYKPHGSFKASENPKKKHPWESLLVCLGAGGVQPALGLLPLERAPTSMSPSLTGLRWAQFVFNHLFLSVGRGICPRDSLSPNAHLGALKSVSAHTAALHWPMEAGSTPSHITTCCEHLQIVGCSSSLWQSLLRYTLVPKWTSQKIELGFTETLFASNVFNDARGKVLMWWH